MIILRKLIAVGVAAAVLMLAVAAYSVLKPPAEASAPITAIPLAQNEGGAAETADTTEVPAAQAGATSAPAIGAAAEATGGSEVVVAQIVPEESEARFIIDEVLNDAPKTVVGTTNQVAGELAVDPGDPAKSRVGTIQLNARTLTTDNDFRNRALMNRILVTDQYEFITFTPTSMAGLPQAGSVGESYTFQMTGNLTIKDVTKEVTFDVTATPQSAARLEGKAATTIRYADYGITIPQVRQVASVADEVRLEIDFVAAAS